MSHRRASCVVAACLVAAGLTSVSPAMASLTAPAADCNQHAALTRTYTVSELRTALATMPADIREYTNCYDVIQRALLARLGQAQGGGSGQGGGSFLPTPVLIVLVALGLAAVSLGVMAVRRRLSA